MQFLKLEVYTISVEKEQIVSVIIAEDSPQNVKEWTKWYKYIEKYFVVEFVMFL